MSEQEPLNTTWRIVFAAITLAFNAAVLWWLLLYGNEGNSLHASALSWTFMLSGCVLAGIGFGAVKDIVPSLFGKTDKAG